MTKDDIELPTPYDYFDDGLPGWTNLQITEAFRTAAEADRQQRGGEPIAWMTHHDEPMIFTTSEEAATYCNDDEEPIPLYASPQPAAPALGPSDAQWQTLALWLDRRRINPTVQISGDVAGDISDLLARHGQPPATPEGWQLVPKEPTVEMMFMGVSEWATHDDSEEDVYGVWEAMLAAAPKFGEEE